MTTVAVFCGSSVGARPAYRETAEELGVRLAQRGARIVYGGGRVGLMGVVAGAALGAGGEVVGVIPRALATKEVAHDGLTELREVDSMHDRKATMARLSDAFVALPGGFGTFEELLEVVTWLQLGVHDKPVAALNVDGFYDSLVGLIDRAVVDGFIRPEQRRLVIVERSVPTLLDALDSYAPVDRPRWLSERWT